MFSYLVKDHFWEPESFKMYVKEVKMGSKTLLKNTFCLLSLAYIGRTTWPGNKMHKEIKKYTFDLISAADTWNIGIFIINIYIYIYDKYICNFIY